MKKELERLKRFRKTLKLSQGKFGEPLGSNQSSISDVERGKVGISSELLRGLILKYRLNPFWLFFGKPPMQISESDLNALSDTATDAPQENVMALSDDGGMIPLTSANLVIPVDLHTEYTAAVKTGKWDIERMSRAYYAKVPGISGETRTFQVKGDSMAPSFMHGDFVCCKPVFIFEEIRTGGVYLVVSQTKGIYLARLTYSSRKKTIRLDFDNLKSGGGLELPITDILEKWEVEMRLTMVINSPFESRLQTLEERLKSLSPN